MPLGKIEEFDDQTQNIRRYIERLEQYFEANEVPTDEDDSNRRRAILLSVLGAKTYDIVSDLCSPETPATKTYEQLKEVLKSHFAPKKLLITERFRYRNCLQEESQTVSEFSASLKRLASTCEYGEFLPQALRDGFVCGLRNATIQEKLLREDYSFQEALQIAINMEMAIKDIAEVNPKQRDESTTVHKIQRNSQPSKAKPNNEDFSKTFEQPKLSSSEFKCLSCGYDNHKRAECKFRNATCHSCGKQGHISRVCKSKPVRKVESESGEQGELFSHSLYSIGSNKGLIVRIRVQEQTLPMEIDTGASVTLISKETYTKYFNNIILHPSHVKLHTYTRDEIEVCGQFNADVQYESQHATLPITVIEGTGPSLIGRDWLYKLKFDWNKIFEPDTVDNISNSNTNHQLQALLRKYPNVFKDGLGTMQGITAKLELKEEAKPKFCKARPVPYALQPAVEEEYNRLEREGIIEKVKYSEWGTPMVHIPKSDGKTRSCGDYSVTLNPSLKVPQYPVPLPEDVFRKLAGGKLYSKLDLTNAYQQMLLDPESQQYVTINTHRGLYRYKRLPFGVASSPAIFQQSMDIILQGLPSVAAIQDDILITGQDDAQHLANLESVLQRLDSYGLRVKLEKCRFVEEEVTYMGVKLSTEGISPTQEKIEAIANAPVPENTTQLRAFLGMVNYHSKFIANLSTILQPLNQLLQKERPWVWSTSCQRAFQAAKDSLSSSQVLVHFDPKLPIILETDASQYGVGAVISHRFPNGDERPIAYASRSLKKIHKEGLAIIFGITKFYMYLYGRHFTLYTDHQPLLKIFAPDAATPVLAAARLQRWSLLLSAYRYDIKFRSSKNIPNADALSRLPLPYRADSSVESKLYYTVDQQFDLLPVSTAVIARETAKDRVLTKVASFTQHGWFTGPCNDETLKPYFVRKDELSCEQGCVMWGARVIVPPPLQNRVLEELHTAHPGVAKMKAVARSFVWWPKMDTVIEDKVRNCQSCATTMNNPPAAPLHPWCWPVKPWQRLHIDFGTFKSKHYLIVVDAHSKWPEVIGPMGTTTAESTANALRPIFARLGLPEQIVSDNGPPFQSNEYNHFLKMNGIQRILTSPYHQASNGQAERFIQTFKNFMKTATAPPGNLHKKIQDFLLTYRSSPHATTGVTPAKLLLGRELRTRLSLIQPNLQSHVENKQAKMKQYHDTHATCREFALGQTVLARDHRSTQAWQPATVMERKTPHSYSVGLPDGRVWNRHVDHLLRGAAQGPTCTSDNNTVTNPSPLISTEGTSSPSPDSSSTTPANDGTTTTRSGRAVKPPRRFIEEV